MASCNHPLHALPESCAESACSSHSHVTSPVKIFAGFLLQTSTRHLSCKQFNFFGLLQSSACHCLDSFTDLHSFHCPTSASWTWSCHHGEMHPPCHCQLPPQLLNFALQLMDVMKLNFLCVIHQLDPFSKPLHCSLLMHDTILQRCTDDGSSDGQTSSLRATCP